MDNIKLGFILFVSLFTASCQKADDNGELGAFWKLLEVEHHAEASKSDHRLQSLFMAVQLNLMQFSGNGLHYARFQHQGDSLFVQMIGDADDEFFENFGFYGPELRFLIERLNRNSLVLKSEHTTLYFKKF